MIATVNKDLYRYEIQALIKAFYPREEVKVLPEHADSETPFFKVKYTEDAIYAAVLSNGKEILARSAQRNPNEASYTEKASTTKDALKHLVYHLLSSHTGETLPWGELIGIRPTKIARKKLEEGISFKDTAEYLQNRHFVTAKKALLATEIADREREILGRTSGKEGYSLYVGIPFCPTTCLYCSFPSNAITLWKDRVEDYLSTLIREMSETSGLFQNKAPDTVYIGGGTPTTLSPDQLDRLLSAIKTCFSLEKCMEFTVEAGRPDSITREKLQVLKNHAVDRISINPQSMRKETLDRIGRLHSPEAIEEAFLLAREEGFQNINMDMILGLPGEGIEDVEYTLDRIKALRPDALTVHTLAVKRGSKLDARIREEGYEKAMQAEMSSDQRDPIEEMMDACFKTAGEIDMLPYYLYRQKNLTGNHENIGFARKECFGIYNSLIIEETQSIVAFGAGSIAKAVLPDGKIVRSEDPKDITTYLSGIGEILQKKQNLFRFL